MRIDTVGHQCAVGSGNGRASSRARWCCCRTIGGTGVSIGGADAVGSGSRLGRLRRVRVASQTRAFKKMLLLSRGILCADLLTIDTLHGEALNETGLVC